jgi:hypothetical protein
LPSATDQVSATPAVIDAPAPDSKVVAKPQLSLTDFDCNEVSFHLTELDTLQSEQYVGTASDAVTTFIQQADANESWYFDTGADSHLTGNIKALTSVEPQFKHSNICTASGDTLLVCGKGSVSFSNSKVNDVYYVPGVKKSSLSVGKLTDPGNATNAAWFGSRNCFIYNDKSHKLLMRGVREPSNSLYKL